MGLVYKAHACDTCAYQAHGELDYYGGKLGFFYGIATCQTCHNLVSSIPDEVHIPPQFVEKFGGRKAYILHMEDVMAQLYPSLPPVNICTLCNNHDLFYHDLWDAFQTNNKLLIVPCPRCEIGHVQLYKIGYWD